MLGFLFKVFHSAGGVDRFLMRDFNGHVHLPLPVADFVDLPHTAITDKIQDPVQTQNHLSFGPAKDRRLFFQNGRHNPGLGRGG